MCRGGVPEWLKGTVLKTVRGETLSRVRISPPPPMDKKTIETYNQLAREYDEETSTFWEEFPQEFVNFFGDFVGLTKGRVLDVGSGPGRDGLILKGKGLDVICLDASEEMVKMSKERGLESLVGDFNSLPFEDNFFGGVWAYTSLLHVPKAEVGQVLAEIRRVLQPGGIFALGMIEGESEGYRESSGVKQLRWFSFYSKEELEKLLSNYGFEIISFVGFKPRTKNYLNFVARKI